MTAGDVAACILHYLANFTTTIGDDVVIVAVVGSSHPDKEWNLNSSSSQISLLLNGCWCIQILQSDGTFGKY